MFVVAVTGVTGKSGQYFVKRLLHECEKLTEYKFKFLCRKSDTSKNQSGYELLKDARIQNKLNVEIVDADLTCPEQVKSAFGEKVDMLLHVAGIKFTKAVVPIAMECGVDNLVLVHTTGIYSKYKAAGEGYRQIESEMRALVSEYKEKGREIALTILRPTMIYGDLNDCNVSTFIKMVNKYRLFPTINGARYDLQPVWCKDLGDAYYSVITNWHVTKNKEYILSGGAPIQLRDMFKEIASQLGVKNKFISCPYPIAYFGAWVVYILSFSLVDYREKVQRMVEPRAYSHELAKKDFGYSPVEFGVGVREEIQAFKDLKNKRCK